MFTRFLLVAALAFPALPGLAQSKEEACRQQGDLVGAIQQARLDRVRQAEVVPTLVAANPEWEKLSEAMPQMVEFVYGLKRRDLRKVALGPVTEAQCLQNWDQLQALTKN